MDVQMQMQQWILNGARWHVLQGLGGVFTEVALLRNQKPRVFSALPETLNPPECPTSNFSIKSPRPMENSDATFFGVQIASVNYCEYLSKALEHLRRPGPIGYVRGRKWPQAVWVSQESESEAQVTISVRRFLFNLIFSTFSLS